MNDAIRMQISAFVDGELPDSEAELLMRRLSQDAALREQAAEYFAIGRAMRGQLSVQGLGQMRARISAAIDDSAAQADFEAIEPAGRRLVRPVAGAAIAATVALVAILGLQQFQESPELGPASAGAIVADEADASGYTVPRVYQELHYEGVSTIDARLTTFRALEDELETLEDEDEDSADETAESDAPEAP